MNCCVELVMIWFDPKGLQKSLAKEGCPKNEKIFHNSVSLSNDILQLDEKEFSKQNKKLMCKWMWDAKGLLVN